MNIREYVKENGEIPFEKWISKLDRKLQLRIRARLARIVETNNLGVSKKIKGQKGLFEFIFTMGPGIRIYFGLDGEDLILLLIGGDKSTQKKDILKAASFWEDYNA